MKVIGVGFGRTGTLSLKVALDELGLGPCYHMSEAIRAPGHKRMWLAGAQGTPMDWEAVFAGYRSTVDWPACFFWRELVAAYPDAKIILTGRDPEKWYASTYETIYRLSTWVARVAAPLFPTARGMAAMTRAVIWDGTFGGRFEDRAHAIEVFQRHMKEVVEEVPADRLLVYDVRQGWEPLCRFLGVEVPEGRPFPHVNDRDAQKAKIARARRLVGAGVAVAIGVAAAAAVFAALRGGG
ncbi:sulfotransferase family protein [Nocardiopsis sediminis]|uniref:Sulfotransferase family protein n=1 Tax=Nocardiopsis sediminis TaxID=1778267 RepID=A0ABV8FQL7_9ACTN